jgi:hypothetical protein
MIFKDLRRIAKDSLLSESEKAWVKGITDADTGRVLIEFRDATIHRLVRRKVIVDLGVGRTSRIISTTKLDVGDEEEAVTLARVAGFVEDRWRQFWAILEGE